MSERLDTWMDNYVLAWSNNEATQIASLFSSDAVYDSQTAAGERNGLDEIVAWWTDLGDSEDNWEFEWQPLVEDDDVAVVTGRTRYIDPPLSYRNLFVIRFDDKGRCYDFTEWYIEEASG
jgi:hypothetical protein